MHLRGGRELEFAPNGRIPLAPFLGTMGRGARRAWLVSEHGLSRQDAYMLCSLAGDQRILEVVDPGTWNVGITIPLSIFR